MNERELCFYRPLSNRPSPVPLSIVRITMKKTEVRSKTFEMQLAALEKVVRELERGDLPLEESLKLFEDGVRLSRECQERLNQAERRIEVLLRDGEGRPVLSAFDEEDANDFARTGLDAEAGDDENVF
jgi:exodeoxyribonuclease VII small subunit